MFVFRNTWGWPSQKSVLGTSIHVVGSSQKDVTPTTVNGRRQMIGTHSRFKKQTLETHIPINKNRTDTERGITPLK